MRGESTKKFGKFLKKYNPDGVILLGDRYEILSAGIASLFLKIPIIHLQEVRSQQVQSMKI